MDKRIYAIYCCDHHIFGDWSQTVRMANLNGRATLLTRPGGGIDVATASGGRFPADPQGLFETWDAFTDWADGYEGEAEIDVDPQRVGPPTPAPRQVFAVGLNYDEHVNEAAMGKPTSPTIFTKFPSSIAGPHARVLLPSATVDWEVELVVAIGRLAYEVGENQAWSHVAGLMVGQDLSERMVQLAGPVPQFSLGKSYPGFAPLGPALVTPDELDDPDDLELGCSINGEVLQHARTTDMIFTVPELIARLSAVCPLLPGDIIFTGTPSGVGNAREPKRFLTPGSVLSSYVVGVGELHNELAAGNGYSTPAA